MEMIKKKKNVNPNVLHRFHYSQDRVIEKPFNWQQMLRLMQFMKPYMKNLVPKSLAVVLLNTVIRLAIPIIIGYWILEKAIVEKNGPLLINMVILVALLYLVSYLANYLRIRWTNELGQNVIFDIRREMFVHVQNLSHNFFDKRSGGSILVRIMNDTNSLQDLFTSGVINVLMDIIMLAGIVGILFSLSPKLTLAVLIVLPLMFIISSKLRRNIRRAWQEVRLIQSKLNSHLNESLQGIRTTQAFTQEVENMAFFEGINIDTFEKFRTAIKKDSLFRPLVDLTNAVGTVILILYGTYLLLGPGDITIGVFASFAFYIGMFWEPISRLGQFYNQLLVAMASSERIFEYLDEKPLVADKPEAKELDDVKGHIQFKNVVFSYDQKRTALNGINLDIKPGETVALVGHTGSGKTTIANLISRFYDVTDGQVLIDGIDVRDISLRSLRKHISIVLQETFIFSGSILDNIRFGRPDATDEEVEAAARAVGADHFINRLPYGYDTEVEERGNILSVGERQLLSFARTLLADPKILILDEATASIDTETEVQIQKALNELLKGRTSIIIAHRLSTIRDADKIYVLDHGEIIEAGNHEQLMELRGEYYQLLRTQFKMLNE